MQRILIICMGNICRSPVVEAVVREHAQRAGLALDVHSAGTEGYHIGEPADARSIASARARGYDIGAHRARRVAHEDFSNYDWLLTMDRTNLHAVSVHAPSIHAGKLALFLEFAGVAPPAEVPDPYYGSARDFERVIDLAESGAQGLIARLVKAHNVPNDSRSTGAIGNRQ